MESALLDRITVEPGKRGGQPCIRRMRMTVRDVLECLASGMTQAEILDDFPYLEPDDVRACLAFAVECLPKPQPLVPSARDVARN